MQRKQNNFGRKYGNGKKIIERLKGLITWKNVEKNLKKVSWQICAWTRYEQHLRKYQIGKFQAMMVFMDSVVKDLCLSMTDWLKVYTKETYARWWRKKIPKSRRTIKRDHPQNYERKTCLSIIWKPRTISRRTKKTLHGNKTMKWPTIYRMAHPQSRQNEAGRCIHSMDW